MERRRPPRNRPSVKIKVPNEKSFAIGVSLSSDGDASASLP